MMHVPASLPGSPQARLLPQPPSLQKDSPPRPVGPAPCVPAAPAQIQSAGFITPTAHLQHTFLAHAHEC